MIFRLKPARSGVLRSSCVFIPLFCATVAPQQALAAEPLEILITTGQMRPMAVDEATSQVSVISAQELAQQKPENVAQALQTVPGFQLNQMGGAGQAVDYGIRGSSSRHVLVLVDGVRVGSASVGQAALQQYPMDAVERIEVLRGPRSALYGSDAMGGVINIITKRAERGGELSLTGGSHRHLDGMARLSGISQNGALRGSVSFSQQQEQGFDAVTGSEPDPDGFQRQSLMANAEYELRYDWHLFTNLQYITGWSEYDALGGMTDKSDYLDQLYALGLRHEGYSRGGELQLSHSSNQSEDYLAAVGKLNPDRFSTRRTALDLSLWQQLSPQVTASTGGQWYREDLSASSNTMDVAQRDIGALFGRVEYRPSSSVSLEAGTRYELIEHIDNVLTWSAAAGYRLGPVNLGASYDTAFKAPTFNDLYFPGSGNPELSPESARSYELFIKQIPVAGGEMAMTWFDTQYQDLIAWAPGESGMWKPENIDEARMQGLELELGWRAERWHSTLHATLQTAEDGMGQRIAQRAERLASWTLGYRVAGMDASMITRYMGDRVGSTGELLDPYTTLDMTLGYQLTPKLRSNLKLVNLLDRGYYTSDGIDWSTGETVYYNGAGRSGYLTLNYQL